MASLDIKLNINGELIELKDIDKVVKALTKKQRDEIDKLKQDIVSIDNNKVTAKKFEILGNEKIRKSLEALVSDRIEKTSVFTKMIAFPVGMQASEFITYLDVKIQPDVKTATPVISVQPIQVATQTKWQSKSFTSRVTSVTEGKDSLNKGVFKAGSVKILVQNNSLSSLQGFNSKVSSVVSNKDGDFQPGKFFINNKSMSLNGGDSLNDICNKINNCRAGVKASIEENEVGAQFKLTIQSEKIGSENSILIDDPNGVFSKLASDGGSAFIPDPQYETVELEVGDTLNNIAYKINKFEKTTNLRADVFQMARGQYTLVLKSLSPGIANTFQIIDDLPLTGSNSGKVFNDVFDSTVSVTTGTKASVTLGQDAKIIIDGTELSNTINSFEVYNGIDVIVKAASSKPMAFEVRNDINAIFMEISGLVEKYNLMRQIYLDSISEDRKAPESQLEKNYIISNAMENMDLAFQKLEYSEIGISRGSLELDKTEGDKTVKKEYKNMAILDKSKLFDILTDEPEKIRKAFDISFDSSSSNFIEPFISKKIGINNKPLDGSTIDLNVNIDVSKLRVRSRASVKFRDVSNVVDGNDKSKLKPGTFWINGSPVTIKAGMSLEQVVYAVNAVSNMSRISATDNSNYIELTRYSGNFPASDDSSKFERMNIYDPNCILQDAFSSVMQTKVFDEKILPNTGTFTINGVTIQSHSKLNDLLEEINSLTYKTGVTASAVAVGNGKYYLDFKTNKLEDIVIDNSLGGLDGIVLPKIESQQSNNYFFDTSAAVTGSVSINAQKQSNPIVLIVNGSDIKGGGTIFPLNINNSGMKIDNLEVLFIGDRSDSAEISISQGLAATLLNEIDEMFKLHQGYKGSTSGILQVNQSIEEQKSALEKVIKNKEDILKGKEKMLLNKFAKAQAQVDQSEAYIDMIKEMMKSND